ncbi:hypothetical protein [Pyxidicoccus parkwayensis]|nr:hypothetical protein [Pyxidicoccus parkwaysis]
MLLPRHGAGRDEGFAQVEPTLVIDGGEAFGINLGAPPRLRAWGGGEGAGLVRKEDWDSVSDVGQVVRALRLGVDGGPLFAAVGQLDTYTLLSGHLVRRYTNRGNPDYHPAGAFLTATSGPLHVEAFASDVLAARLTGVEVELDVQHIFFGRPRKPQRYTLALSVVRDWGRAEVRAPSVTLAHLDATAVLLSRRGYEVHAFAGWGGRPGEGGAWGAVAGVGADAVQPTLQLALRLEARRQNGGFRQGFFGPDYELARFQVPGTSGLPLARAPFRDGYSAFGEALLGWDAVWLGDVLQRHLDFSLAIEAFNWGRVDLDGRVAAQLFNRNLEVAVKGLALGMGEPDPRYLASAEVRWRFLGGRFYALCQGGTLLVPTAEGTLRTGAFASVGMGVDNAR